MAMILKVEGFSYKKKEKLYERCDNLHTPRQTKFIKDFLKTTEDFFTGYWKVNGNQNKEAPLRLKRLKIPRRADKKAWMILPGDKDKLLDKLIWTPVSCIKLERGAMGVPIHYRKIGGISEIYCLEGNSGNQFYLAPAESKLDLDIEIPGEVLKSLEDVEKDSGYK